MAEQEVLLSVDDGVARIRLNRPDQRSALAERDRTTVVSAKVARTSGSGGPAVWRADLVWSS